jgi:5-formyltetrahydrofolate cyclo-ligase
MSSNSSPIKLSAEAARKIVLEKLKEISPEVRDSLSAEICRRTVKALEAHKTRAINSIALYRSLPSEVNLDILEKHFHQAGIKLCYPRVSGSSVFCQVPEPQKASSWVQTALGVHEPTKEHVEIAPNSIDCIVVPGLAFGLNGERIGRGKGYYDRLLALEPNALRVALTFDSQLFEALEQKPWDQAVHWIMTEKRELKLR